MKFKKGAIILIHILLVFLIMDLLIATFSHASVDTLTTELSMKMYTFADEDMQTKIQTSLLQECQEIQGTEEAQFLYCTDEGRAQLEFACSQIDSLPDNMQEEMRNACDQIQEFDEDELCELVTTSQQTLKDPELLLSCQQVVNNELNFEIYFGQYIKKLVDDTISSDLEVSQIQSALTFLDHPWFIPSIGMVLFKMGLIILFTTILFFLTTLTDALKHLIRITRSIGLFLVIIFIGINAIFLYASPDTTGLFSGDSLDYVSLFWLVSIVFSILITIELAIAGGVLLIFWAILRLYVYILTKEE